MNAKHLIIAMLLLLAFSTSYAQINKKNINYTYDAAGNRTTRYVTITLNKKDNRDTTSSAYSDKISSQNNHGELIKYDVSVYPNPSRESLIIKLTNSGLWDNPTPISYYLVDVYGKVILSEISSTDSAIKLNTSTLLPGFYFLNVVTNFEKKSYRIIKI